VRLHFHLAPPLLARRNEKGELVKRRYGPWMMSAFRLLARFRGLRGTAFDPFGYTDERKTERAMIDAYQQRISSLIERLDRTRLSTAVEIASLPERIRGFGHVKERAIEQVQAVERDLIARFDSMIDGQIDRPRPGAQVESSLSRV